MDINNLCGWAMSQKLLINNSEWIKYTFQFNENFIKSYNEESDERYVIEKSWKITWTSNDLQFSPEKIKIEKIDKLVAYLHDKTEYVIPV